LKVAMSKNPKTREDNDLLISLRADYASLNADALKEATGLGSNLSEQDKTEIRTGAKPDATVAQMRAGLKALKRGVTSKLSRFGQTRPEWTDENLAASGLDGAEWAPGIKREPKAAPAAAGGDPELGDGQRLAVNDEGDEVVEGAEATPPSSTKHANRTTGQIAGDKPTNLGVQNKVPKLPVAAPKTIGGGKKPAEPGMVNVIVRGKPRTISEEQAQWLVQQGVEVLPDE